MPFPSLFSLRSAAVLAGVVLLLASCSGGEQRPILASTIEASLVQSAPPIADRLVFFGNITSVGDTIKLDVLVRDSGGTLDVDHVDVLLRYDASFIQMVSLSGQDTLFGNCNTVNVTCGEVSPLCLDTRSIANGGGDRFCRSNGSTRCSTDAECPTSGDVCGSFGNLLVSLVVVTGPHVCSNNASRRCFQDSDCLFCSGGNIITSSCATDAECGGTCNSDILKCASNFPSRSCTSDLDCEDTCGGTCRPVCPSVIVSDTKKITTVTLRVMKAGSSDLRFAISSVPKVTTSGVYNDSNPVAPPPVVFFPNVEITSSQGDVSPTDRNDIVIVGRL